MLVKEFLQQGVACTSVLTLAEISRWFSENNYDVSFSISHIKQLSVLLELEEEILVEAGKQYQNFRKASKAISMIDIILYLTAQRHQLDFITTDSDFAGLQGVKLL